MKRYRALVVLSVAGALLSPPAASTDERYWPQWRGPLATGAAPLGRPPVEWSETKNVRWKVAVPGNGSSTPVVWGDLVFVTAAVPIDKPLQPRTGPATGAPTPAR